MNRRYPTAGLFALLAVTGVMAAEKPQGFPEKLHGDWVATAIEYCGQNPPADIVRKYKVTVKDATIVLGPLSFGDEMFSDDGEPSEMRCVLHPDNNPKAIDLILKEGTAEYKMSGIYAVDGNLLKICWQHDGKGRPTEFKTRAEPTQMLVVLKRVEPTPKPLTYQLPKGWRPIDAGKFSLARFEVGEGDRIGSITITGLAGDGGGLIANVKRWRSILALEPVDEMDTLKSVKEIKVDGQPGHAVDLTGPDVPGKETRRILVAIVKRGDKTWFFKIEGPVKLANEQKAAFDEFVKSIRFEK